MYPLVILLFALIGIAAGLGIWLLRCRGMDRWLVPYLRQSARRQSPREADEVHLLLCIADHFEPRNGGVSEEVARRRLANWVEMYPRLYGEIRDSDGRPPRHSFFYPIERYVAEDLDTLAALCRAGYGEIEIHLHHDSDNAGALRQRLLESKHLFATRHSLLAKSKRNGEIQYGFVHGDWALDNSHPNGRYCGVDNELQVLRETGCYADFTMPSAPEPTQTRKINSIYYARGMAGKRKSHDTGIDVRGDSIPPDALLLVQGPLLLDWKRRKWGLVPRIENACLQGNQPPSADRIDLWLRARIQVPTRPDWFFVKLHTHGGPEMNQRVLLGEPMQRFHSSLVQRAAENTHFHFHYVTAREMYNLVKAAESGWQGSVADAIDFELQWNSSLTGTLLLPTSVGST